LGLWAVLVVAGLAVLAAAQAKHEAAEAKKIEAASFSLVDDKGKQRAALTLTKRGPALTFFDANGAEVGGITALPKGVVLQYNENGKLQAGLSLEHVGVCLGFYNPQRQRLEAGPNAIQEITGLLSDK
jgi:hypothetical protein